MNKENLAVGIVVVCLIVGISIFTYTIFRMGFEAQEEQTKEINKVGTISDIVYNLNHNELTIIFDDHTTLTIDNDEGDYTVSTAHAMLKNKIGSMISITYNKHGSVFRPIMVFE